MGRKDPSKETLVDQWLKKLRNQPIVAAAIVMGVVVTALVSFSNTTGITEFMKSQFTHSGTATKEAFQPTDAFMTREEAAKAQGYIGRDERQVHTAFVMVELKFQEERFNNAAYFASFDNVRAEVAGRPDQQKIGVYARRLSARIEKNKKTSYFLTLSLEFSRRPVAGDSVLISIGPIQNRHSLTEKSFTWHNAVYREDSPDIPWSIAFSKIDYVDLKPDWLVITDAEYLTGNDGIDLLRTTVSNPTEQEKPILYMTFVASAPRIDDSTSCNNGDRAQELVLEWEKQGSSDTLSGKTTLGGVNIPVDVDYSFRGVCSGYFFRAKVPIAESIPANSSKTVMLRLKQLPTPAAGRGRGSGLFRGLSAALNDLKALSNPKLAGLGRIARWPSKSLHLETAQGSIVEPNKFDLSKLQEPMGEQ